jgi:predicted NBD/HSP70 family sugar kinase
LEVTLFNLHLKIELQKRVPFERNSNLEVISELIKKEYDTIVEQKSKANILGITIAVHALVNTKTDICVHAIYFPSWGINIPLAQIISEKLETDIPIYVDSWIWLKTQIAFKYYPIVADVDSFVLIYSGRNGFVTGIYNRDNISESNSHLIGEIGHMIVNPNDKQMCQCGGYGCVESLTDIKRIIQNGNAERENYPNSQIFKNGEVTFDAIIKAFKEDDPLAVKLLDETASWVAIAISNLNLILFPDIVLFEGEICLAGKKWYKMVEEKLEKVSLVRFKNKINLKFVEPNFEAIAEGSAYYIFNQFIKNIYPNLK